MSKAEAKINRELLMLEKDNVRPRIGESINESQSRNVMIVGTTSNIPDLNAEPCSESEGEENIEPEANAQAMIGLERQDANDGRSNFLSDFEVAIFARVSCLEYWKLLLLNKQFSHLLKSSEIFRVRRKSGLVKPYVFLLSGSDTTRWTMFDESFQKFKKLPEIPCDYCFILSDKETISAGTQLIVIGKEVESIVVWRYELELQKWIKGPSMITPRVMYGSASRGNDAYFAGGIRVNANGIPEVVNYVERFKGESKTWRVIRLMHKPRKFCSGCFLHGKFYVIGGRDEKDEYLTCGESYDELTNSWKLIPDMLKDVAYQTFTGPKSPPLIAVVNDNLYFLDTYENKLCVYDINTNSWKKLGTVPVRAGSVGGWGVAFKSLGDRLLLIGSLSFRSMCETMTVYTCRPSPNVEEILWEKINIPTHGIEFSHFVKNCCVMFA